MSRHIVLVGLMGSGKTTVARLLHRKTDIPTYEVDGLIEKEAGKSVAEIFAQDGEPVFRRMERETIVGLAKLTPGIVSTGGGTFIDEENQRVLLDGGLVFYLHGSPLELAKRIQSTGTRPLLQGRDKEEVLRELYQARHPHYQRAQVTIQTDHRTSQEVTDEIWAVYQQKIGHRRALNA